jgi:hypothetical protein
MPKDVGRESEITGCDYPWLAEFARLNQTKNCLWPINQMGRRAEMVHGVPLAGALARQCLLSWEVVASVIVRSTSGLRRAQSSRAAGRLWHPSERPAKFPSDEGEDYG